MAVENSLRRKSSVYLIAVVAYMVVIFILSSLPQKVIPEVILWRFTVSSTVMHMGEYFILSLLVFLWLVNSGRSKSSYFHVFAIAVVASSIYGVTDELHQAFIPTRFCAFSDMLSDFFGSILIAPFTIGFHMRKNRIMQLRNR